jgi:hypothetical protein
LQQNFLFIQEAFAAITLYTFLFPIPDELFVFILVKDLMIGGVFWGA